VAGTHSWIEPTALGVIALKAAGHERHERVQEAIRMILDRQLPHGGWNYGNTFVFGRELRPMPESSGAALAGLAGQVERGSRPATHADFARVGSSRSRGLGAVAFERRGAGRTVLGESVSLR
jgi:hypothetical protein